jgi:hypothetical protein
MDTGAQSEWGAKPSLATSQVKTTARNERRDAGQVISYVMGAAAVPLLGLIALQSRAEAAKPPARRAPGLIAAAVGAVSLVVGRQVLGRRLAASRL